MTMTLHHLALRTGDVPGLADFYREVLGFEVVRRALPRSLWLGLGGDAVLMVEAREAGEPPVPEGSMELVAFRVSEKVRDVVRRKAAERGCLDGETAFTTYLRDPDGRRVAVSTYDLKSLPG